MKRFSPSLRSLLITASIMILTACGGGGGGSTPPPGDGTLPGGNGGGGSNPPKVLSASPTGDAVPVDSVIELKFDKLMRLSSFQDALDGLGNIGYQASCGADCSTIRLSHPTDLEYNQTYHLTLKTTARDQGGILLPAAYSWSFKTAVFVPPLSFKPTTVDGGAVTNADSGECTAMAVDSTGRAHIVYYSESDGAPKHAACPATRDCLNPQDWTVELIDHPVDTQTLHQKFGRDINLVIDGNDVLHVSYRDVVNTTGGIVGDGIEVLKYARRGPSGWTTPVVVEDTIEGVTDTYIAVGNDGSVHITYRKNGASTEQDILSYAVCPGPCSNPSSPWTIVPIDQGRDAGAPNHIVVTPTAIHISYYMNQTLKYATCLSSCTGQQNWNRVVVDDGLSSSVRSDVGTENSLAVAADGKIHVTYRDNTGGLLKYARCDGACTAAGSWQKVAIDGAGGSSQIKAVGGVLHLTYRDDLNKDLKYANCQSANCLDPSHWKIYRVDAPGEVGWDTYLDIHGGTVYISYRDAGSKALKYASSNLAP